MAEQRSNNVFWFLLVVILGLAGFSVASRLIPVGESLVPWQTDLDRAQQQAATEQKPLLVYFTASWCGPCQQMARNTWTDASVAEAMADVIPVKIDIDEQPGIAARFGIEGVPSFFLMDAGGNALRAGVGGRDPDQFIEWLTPLPRQFQGDAGLPPQASIPGRAALPPARE